LPLDVLLKQCQDWDLTPREKKIAGELVREVRNRLQFLVDVGLDYLTVGRSAPTLSGGEAQRIRLASQVGSGLCGVLYVLDEPTIGLHPRDNLRLIRAMEKLRDLGNTLLVVEHDREVVAGADQLLDFGPGSGRLGGEVVARGTPAEVAQAEGSVTGPYLSGRKAIPIPTNRRATTAPGETVKPDPVLVLDEDEGERPKRRAKQVIASKAMTASTAARLAADRLPTSHGQWLEVIGARHNNLRGVNVAIPLGTLTAFAGVSGSGKSSLVEDVLYAQLAKTLHRARTFPGTHDEIRGLQSINKVIRVDQQPLGNSPTSNPATYTGAFDLIRSLFSQLPDAKLRGYTARRFSFNVPGGRCDACDGNGQVCIEMHFLPDIWVECETCRGQRYNPETLAVLYHGRSIADVLNLSCGEAVVLFENIPKIRRVLQTLCDVGLDYLTLGQSAPTLSGGEAQRVKLAAELARPDTGRTLYLLDEPTTGLHFDDLAKLLDVLHRLVDLGNTVVVIEHNMDVIKSCDWIVEMGPEAGQGGGQVVTCGTPEEVVAYAARAAAAGGYTPAITQASLNVKPKARKSKKATAAKVTPAASPQSSTPLLRSHTGEALAPVLAAGPYVEREVFDPAAMEEKRSDDVELEEVGAETQMPWEADGRRWHTHDRISRTGEACRWDGEILGRIVDRIHDLGEFSETNWNSRSVVEISAERKSDGWFMHALTGEAWLLMLKFRTAKSTFKREELVADLALKPLNDMPDLPVYGSRQRVRCKTLRGPWQEIQIDLNSWEEADTPAFWNMLEKAAKGFFQFTERAAANPQNVMPWKAMGQKWHFSRKGFPPGKKVDWDADLLEELCELLQETAPAGQFLWNNQQVVHLMVPQQREPWASLYTKRLAGVDLSLNGPKGQFTLGRIADLAAERELATDSNGRDQIKFRFTGLDELSGELGDFLRDHLGALDGATVG
jgi:excinuclease ABC subunit A